MYLKKLLFAAGVSKIEIERSNEVVTIYLHVARPGVVIGKGGEQIEQYRKDVEKLIGKTVKLNIVEVRNPDMDAQLVAENIAAQLEKRISHRRAMKNAMGRAMRAGAKGIKCNCGGRLGGREIVTASTITRVPSPCRRCVPTSTTALLRLLPPSGRIGVKRLDLQGRDPVPGPAHHPRARWTPASPIRSVVSVAATVVTVTAAVASAAMARTAASIVTVRTAASTAVPVPRAASASPQKRKKEALSNASAQES